MLKTTFAALLGLTGSANAFWRMECPGRLTVARLDPIVNPNGLSAHAHSIHGSSKFSSSSDTSNLIGDMNGCTSCRVAQDKSAYWHPSLYFHDSDTGKYELVEQVGGMLAYYLLYGDDIQPFPDGFRMIAGDTIRRNYTLGDFNKPDPPKSEWKNKDQIKQSDLEQRALGFNCLNYDKPPEGTLDRHGMPSKQFCDDNCTSLRLEIMFPSCWNGKLDSEDHKSHMAYPDLVMNGNCPSDFPIRVPSLMYETIWRTSNHKGKNGQFVLSNGDTTGFGYHADFITGWVGDTLKEAIKSCRSDSGLITDCNVFKVISEDEARSCQLETSVPKEIHMEVKNMNSLGDTLPGNVKIGGNDVVSGPDLTNDDSSPKPILDNSIDKPTGRPIPGLDFKESFTSVSVPTTTQPPKTTEPGHYSTQYITNGNIVTEIYWDEEVVTVTRTVESVVTVTDNALKRRSHHLHGHAHRH